MRTQCAACPWRDVAALRNAADWDEWVELANAIVAIDEIKHRQEAGEL